MNSANLEKKFRTASFSDIIRFLDKCSNEFKPELNIYIDLKKYGQKIFDFASIFELWDKTELVGLIAAYFNNVTTKVGFITLVCIHKDYQNYGFASILLRDVINYAEENHFVEINLEVNSENLKAIGLYKKFGFKITKESDKNLTMKKIIRFYEKEAN